MRYDDGLFFKKTRRLGDVRSHMKFRPRSSTLLAYLSTKWGTEWQNSELHILFQKITGVNKCFKLKSLNKYNNLSIRGPTGPVIKKTTREDKKQNQL